MLLARLVPGSNAPHLSYPAVTRLLAAMLIGARQILVIGAKSRYFFCGAKCRDWHVTTRRIIAPVDAIRAQRTCRHRAASVDPDTRADAGDAGGAAALRALGHARRMAEANPDRREPPGDRGSSQHPPSAGAGAHTTNTIGTLVLRCSDCSWGGSHVGADLPGALPSHGRRQRPRGSRCPY